MRKTTLWTTKGELFARRGLSWTDRLPLGRSSLWGALSLAAVATIMRPSNAVIWITLGTSLLYHSPPTKRSSILVAVSTIG